MTDAPSKTARPATASPSAAMPERVTGVELMRGIGHKPALGFWADAWAYVIRRPGAIFGLSWVAVLLFFACFSPFIASGHPYILRQLDEAKNVTETTFPLFSNLSPGDILLPLGLIVSVVWMAIPIGPPRSQKLGTIVIAAITAGAVAIVGSFKEPSLTRCLIAAALFAAPAAYIAFRGEKPGRAAAILATSAAVTLTVMGVGQRQLASPDYLSLTAAGTHTAVFAPIPWSPLQKDTARNFMDPGFTQAQAEAGIRTRRQLQNNPDHPANSAQSPGFVLGTDSLGQDVLSQLLHASRLSISIGLVSTGIAVFIGVTLGALMGYFGGKVDIILFRLVEIVQSVPVLFLLIVAAGVLPPEFRSTYVIMAIIGFFTWTGSARFIRAEFFKLRNMDFVQSAKATGLPLRSVLFKHMLPNGVTPVLVEASFAVAVAIQFEAILSFLGLGPVDQASWGRLLSDTTSQAGKFAPYIAMSAGFAIFLSVLSLTLIGEALRDAIDPKLKKARV